MVNLTVPAVHAEVTSAAIAAGKHVWSEKPISIDRESGLALLDQAAAAGLLVGVAPDTVLGPASRRHGGRSSRGDIGEPLPAQTIMQYPGPDLFHPNPEFLFAGGGGAAVRHGPVLPDDAGPPVRTVRGGFGRRARGPGDPHDHGPAIGRHGVSGRRADARRRTRPVRAGRVSQSVFSFDSPLVRMGVVEITGTEGTMIIPDPNTFTGEVKITRPPTLAAISEEPQWEIVPEPGTSPAAASGSSTWRAAIRNGGSPDRVGRARLPRARRL